MCLGLYFPLLYIKIFNCLLVSFLKRHLASAFCTHVMLSCVLKPMLGAGSPVTSPEALFPHVPSRGLVFGGQRMLVSSPGLRLSAWQGADSSLYSRSQAGSQEPGVRAAKTVTFNVLYSKIYEHVSKQVASQQGAVLGWLVYGFTPHPCLLPPCFSCQMQVHSPFQNTVETRGRKKS